MIRYKPKLSIVGMASGMLLGFAVLVLLHQNGTLYPTRTQAVLSVAGGLLVGILLPSLVRLARVRAANRRIAAARPAAR